MSASKQPENPPAFPCPPNAIQQSPGKTTFVGGQEGMTLRDYFAAKAMQSFIIWALPQRQFEGCQTAAECAASYSKAAYQIADAMLLARTGKEAP